MDTIREEARFREQRRDMDVLYGERCDPVSSREECRGTRRDLARTASIRWHASGAVNSISEWFVLFSTTEKLPRLSLLLV